MSNHLLLATEIEPPKGLAGHALHAWQAAVTSLGTRAIARSELLTLEAACRAWARWRSMEEKIAELSQGNVLAGELSKGANGTLQTSALRAAADAALAEWKGTAGAFGLVLPDARLPGEETDLFGYPVRPGRGKPGRPRFQVTQRDRNKVRLLLALGWSNTRIANAIEVSLPTLHRYFRAELKQRDAMRDRLDARRFEIAMEQANAGNIAALKELGRMIERNDLMTAETAMGAQPKNDDTPAEKVGKKIVDERRAIEADAELMAELEREATLHARH